MMFTKTFALVATLAVAPLTAHAHVRMASPAPFAGSVKSPLDPSGSNFPCQAVSYTGTKSTDWKVGSQQVLSFDSDNTAVHGGGSCQVSVTTDKAPTKASKWKVIYSIEGGCPASTVGNIGDTQGTGEKLGEFPFTVPSELPNGDLVMAWSWFNRRGNREFYMNCAPVTISGGASDKTAFEALPDMAVANIAGQGTCATKENFDYTFENPGNYVIRAGVQPLVGLCGGAPSSGGGSGNTSPQQPSASNGISSAAPSSQALVASPSPTPVASSANAVVTSTMRTVITVTASLGPKPTQTPAATPVSPSPVASASPMIPVPSTGTVGSGSACPLDGSIVCNGTSKFGVCNHGQLVWQDVAAGTSCEGGNIIAKRDVGMYVHRNQRSAI